eukprot:TRINITY_DN9683_c0_g4_i1.p1 TRINITY_DN9683_c0_g4~~TRINITY_DN9683_c0_g4_i1.p1  ORF type:complete len:494 (+),score=110.16 TRINITY_DN9683_c0_g4_i1:72-1553(+)
MERFERIDKLGEGGQGKVYKVRKKDTGAVVVLKMINCSDPTFATLAEREIEVMKACIHPHIIKFHESFRHCGKSGNWVCLVMEYCSEGDLFTKFKTAVQEKKRFDETKITSWICQIASGLQYMHEKDLWHRDIKAANVLFDDKGVLKLGDFGLSSSYSPHGHKTVVGTPFYFAPEIMLNQQYSNKVDIWNLGVVMLELLTFKQLPVNVEVLRNDRMHAKIMQSILKEGYSKKLAMLVCSMLSKLPDDRPSAREILQQITHEDDGVVGVPEREFRKSEALLRETLAAHPLFAKSAKKAADAAQKKVRSKTPPNHHLGSATVRHDERKRTTLAEGEIQRLIASEEEKHVNGVKALATQFDRAHMQQHQQQQQQQQQHQPMQTAQPMQGAHPGHRQTPAGGSGTPPATGQWGNTRTHTTPTSPRPVHHTHHQGAPLQHGGVASPFRSPPTPSGAAPGTIKSPTSPIPSPGHAPNTMNTRRVNGVSGWPNHPRSPRM